MLMQIRERASGIVAYIIVILISIPFALWGIQEYLGGGADQNVAEVNDVEISKRVFDNQVQDQRRRLKSLLGSSYDSVYQDDSQLKQSVLDSLIENSLLNDETKSAGYQISNTQLFERIKSVPQFQTDGKFDQNRYDQLLAAQRRSKVEFEEQLRQEARVNQYQGSIVFSSFLPSNDKTQFASLKTQKRQFDYIFIQTNVKSDEISSDEVSAYYEKHKEQFKTPARVKLEYIEILQQEIADSLEFDEDELMLAYEDDPDRYRTAELRKASHVLFKIAEGAGEQEIEQVFAKARDAADKIKAGKEFGAIAKELSEDSISANNGGDLGFLSRTDIDNPAFVEKLFSMQIGEVSEPIRTNLGVQIVRLSEITPSKLKPFDEVRSRVSNELRSLAAEKEFIKRAERLQELTYENEDTLSVAAESMGVTVQASDWVSSPSGEGITSHQKVITAAFSDEVLNKGFNSELLELADGHVAAIRVAEHQDAEIQSVDAVAEFIKTTLAQQKAVEQSLQTGERIIGSLRDAPDQMQAISAENGFTLESTGKLLRDDNSVSAELLTHVFRMPALQNDQPLVDGFQLSDGRYAIVRLTNIEQVEDSNAAVETAEWISIQGKYGRREMSSMLKALRETGDIAIFTENM